jgi:hypothetical protein
MKKEPALSFDNLYKFGANFEISAEEVDHYIDECRRSGLINSCVNEDGFYSLTVYEDMPLELAVMIHKFLS